MHIVVKSAGHLEPENAITGRTAVQGLPSLPPFFRFALQRGHRILKSKNLSVNAPAAILAAILVLQGAPFASPASQLPLELHYRIAPQPSARGVPRIGVNLGSRTYWGAEQLMANILANPGFEPTIDGAVVSVRAVSGSEFTDDTPWLARPTGFWTGATFSVRTGHLAGLSGRIIDSGLWQGYPHFRAGQSLSGLAPGDIVALSRSGSPELPAHWWWQNPTRIHPSPSHPTPSSGSQSLLMAPLGEQPVAALSYVDMLSARAGRLLPLAGEWEVSFWARSEAGGRLTVQLRRENAPPFLRQNTVPTATWRLFRFRFTPHDDAPPAGLEFHIEAQGSGSRIWIDDVSLAPVATAASGFRPEVIATLRQLHPGYLRDWQGQLGDTFANRLATQAARRPFRYRPGDESAFGYSLPEFVELCHQVDARPWIVLPTTLNDEEWRAAGAWMRDTLKHYGFSEIVVEFGNENWNALFRPAGIMNADRMAEAAQRGFRLLTEAAGHDPRILPALGGQSVNPSPLGKALSAAPAARLAAFAPYYAREIHLGDREQDEIAQLFLIDSAELDAASLMAQKTATQPAIYEMNAHSLDGDAPPEEVSRLVASQAAGSAILFHALAAMESGINRQCLYALASFDTFRQDGKLVRLFGLTRDLASPGRLRPTGLAMAMANQAIAGDAYALTPVSSGIAGQSPIAIRAFLSNGRWSFIAASASPRELEISIEIPYGAARPPNTLLELTGFSPLSTNEDAALVVLKPQPLTVQSGRIRFHLAPYGAAAAYTELPSVPNRNGSSWHASRPIPSTSR